MQDDAPTGYTPVVFLCGETLVLPIPYNLTKENIIGNQNHYDVTQFY